MLLFVIGWLWIPTTLLAAYGADIRSQIREFSWALNQWTGLKQPYIGFFSFVPMDIYPTAHYMWPANPTYLTDQHNIVLTVFYGAFAAVSRYFTDSNDAGIVALAALQWLFAAFCCAATANRFFNLPWRRLGVGTFDFSHPNGTTAGTCAISPIRGGCGGASVQTARRREDAFRDSAVLHGVPVGGVRHDLTDQIAVVRVRVRLVVRRVV